MKQHATLQSRCVARNLRLKDFAMETYILLGCGFGLALLIAIWGIWKLR
jgi:hypothetical protein